MAAYGTYTKQDGRDWMERRKTERKPLPSMQEIRTMLGWGLVDAARMEPARAKAGVPHE